MIVLGWLLLFLMRLMFGTMHVPSLTQREVDAMIDEGARGQGLDPISAGHDGMLDWFQREQDAYLEWVRGL